MPKPERSSSPKKRFTLWIRAETFRHLEQMQAESGRGGVAEVVRDAIEVYLSLHRARRRGVELFFEDSATGEEGRIWLLPGPVPGDRP